MPLKKHRPVTPSLRFTVASSDRELSRERPLKSLVKAAKSSAGRNSAGRITVRHRGGGHKRKVRLIDFKRDKHGIPARVAAITYDPNRSAHLALLVYRDGEKRYIIAPAGVAVGMTLVAGAGVEAAPGNAMPLSSVPLGSQIHNLELVPGRGGKLVRGAGMAAVLMSREGGYAQVKLPSGEIRRFHVACMATLGQVGHADHAGVRLGKAGRKRWLGIRPTVRGVAMNPVDHPMGGGEGRSSGGGHPVSPWGKITKGMKTRAKRKTSGKMIVSRRK